MSALQILVLKINSTYIYSSVLMLVESEVEPTSIEEKCLFPAAGDLPCRIKLLSSSKVLARLLIGLCQLCGQHS